MKPHSDTEVLEAGKNLEDAEKAVIMLHGRGAQARSMINLADQLPESAAYLAPQAEKRTWYPSSFMEPVENNQPYLDGALNKVEELVEKASEHVGRENVFLLGFSQGACLASEYAARNPDKYGGLIIFSGGLIGEELREYSGDMRKTKVFIGCSENDPHIPIERVDATEQVFDKLNADVEKYVFEGSHHGIVEYEIEKASELIEG